MLPVDPIPAGSVLVRPGDVEDVGEIHFGTDHTPISHNRAENPVEREFSQGEEVVTLAAGKFAFGRLSEPDSEQAQDCG